MNSFKPNDNFFWYLYWACERQNIFWKRFNGEKQPWSEDETFQNVKFTNAYRCLDRESQFLIGSVLYNEKGLNNEYDTEDIFWRILLFRQFNKTETWQLLEQEFGDLTLDVSMSDIAKFLDTKDDVYNKAYMLTSMFTTKSYKQFYGMKKYHAYFEIYREEILLNGYIYEILSSKSMEEMYNKIRKVTGLGDFISMQTVIDINYSVLTDFSENDFIKAGLGAIRGINRTFDIKGKVNYDEIVKWVHENFYQLLEDYSKKFNIELKFKPLPGRDMTLIDIQNCFCETGKYLKSMNPDKSKDGEKHVSHKYYNKNKPEIKYIFPPKWGINVKKN